MGMAFSFGFIIGPALTIAFERVDIRLGKWHIIYENMPGVYMTLFFLCMQIAGFFFVHDLSKAYDYKANVIERNISSVKNVGDLDENESLDEHKNVSDKLLDEKNNSLSKTDTEMLKPASFKKISVCSTLKKLLNNFDISLLLFLSFYIRYIYLYFDIWLPFLIIDRMHWTVTQMNLIIFGSAIAIILLSCFITWKPPTPKVTYIFAITSVALLIIVFLTFMVLFVWNNDFTLGVVMWTICILTFPMLPVSEAIFLICSLAKMVSSEYQTFSEGVRISMSNIGALIALYTSALIFQWIVFVGLVHIMFIFVLVIVMLMRRSSLSKPIIVV